MTKKKRRRPPKTLFLARRVDGCENCDDTLRWRAATSAKPHQFPDYRFTVNASGISVATCGSCQTAHAAVGHVKKFHDALLELILQRPGALTGEEIHFLRKHLNLTGGKFASMVGVSREHVSHIEQGHAPSLGTSADRLARLVLSAKCDPTLKLFKRVLAPLEEDIGTRSQRRAVKGKTGYNLGTVSKRR